MAKRKAIKDYLDFVKSSQRFYRAHIRKLAAHFGGIPELEQVARKFKLGGTALLASPADLP